LTNVVWDAQVHFHGTAFPNAVEWVLQTIRYFANRPDLQLIVRIHPGELLGHTRARQTIMEEITKSFSVLPKNVFIVPPESSISTYTLAAQCNAVLIYGTKAGIELAGMGMPVIVAGEAWVRNKGVTLDANSPAEYFEILNRLPLKDALDKNITERARKYAYHLFFRRMVPLPFTDPKPGSLTEPNINSIEDLLPGSHSGLDVICNGILNGSEFIYPAELYPITAEDSTPVTEESRARGSLRVADMLGKLGEMERMRSYLLKTLREFPWLPGESWAQYSIAMNVMRLALASNQPISVIACFCREMRVIAGQSGFRNRLRTRLVIAKMLTEMATSLWEARSRRLAVKVAGYSLCTDPTQFVKPALVSRIVRAVLRFGLGERVATVKRPERAV
jgi:hypothetical protein